ncbi:unnamed protein product [Gongylonema pulchrum]|uniref:Uncharacterized protein n=1 Tax=Gongylonema pulchrum TaxID=637853 RepID=A0A3P7NGT8_9BILA|nr:unnamed protein product [Gongylonema pulchrum]
MISEVPALQLLSKMEENIGLTFKHIRVLAKAFTRRNTQSVICDDIDMTKYLVTPKVMQRSGLPQMRVKDKADLVEGTSLMLTFS